MDIPDLSEKRLEVFIGKGWVKNFGDLYELERHRDDFISTPGFGEKLFGRITGTIESRRRCTLNQFIAGLGIPMVGRSAGRILNTHFKGDWDAFEQAIKDGFDFTRLQDFGKTMHDNIFAWYTDTGEEKLWRPLLKHITFIKNEKENEIMNTNTTFNGKTVVATGKLTNYTRDGIQMKLLSLGAKPTSSVTKNTDYLIVGENAGSKLDKALKFGIKTISESEFEAMLTGEAV
jgi:DNA ligase (NAD+)